MRRIDLLRELQQDLIKAEKPTVEAVWVLAHKLGLEERVMASNLFEFVPEDVIEAVRATIAVRLTGYPLQLLLGETIFFGHRIKVAKGVLIPRPETEGLVERSLACLSGIETPRVLDIGTGTGAIALSIKAATPSALVWATDINPAAIQIAEENAWMLGHDIVLLEQPYIPELETGLLRNLDLVVSNPPYLPLEYKTNAPKELSYESDSALYSGPDGLEAAREILQRAWASLKPMGWLALELDPSNVYQLKEEATQTGWVDTVVYFDLAGRPRYFLGRKAPLIGNPDELLETVLDE